MNKEKISTDETTDVLRIILTRLDAMEKRLDSICVSCDKMGTHISFIEKVYSKLRAPLDFLMYSVVSPLMNKQVDQITDH